MKGDVPFPCEGEGDVPEGEGDVPEGEGMCPFLCEAPVRGGGLPM